MQRTKLPNLGEFRISKVSAQLYLLCLISTEQISFLPLEILSQKQAESLNGHSWKGFLEVIWCNAPIAQQGHWSNAAQDCADGFWLSLRIETPKLHWVPVLSYPHSKIVFPDDQTDCFSVSLVPLGLSLCVLGCLVCAQQGQAPLSALHSRHNRELSTLPQSSRTKALANQIWAFLLSWGFKGSDYIQHLACWCLCFFKKNEISFLVKPMVTYRRY